MTGPAVDGPSQTVPSASDESESRAGRPRRPAASAAAVGFKACHSKPPAGRYRGPAGALGPAYRPAAARYYRYAGRGPSRRAPIIGYRGHAGSPESDSDPGTMMPLDKLYDPTLRL
eukprot:451574-Hanusia_phi.AAC.1